MWTWMAILRAQAISILVHSSFVNPKRTKILFRGLGLDTAMVQGWFPLVTMEKFGIKIPATYFSTYLDE